MKNVNCVWSGEPDRTPGDKVVDLAAWKAEHLTEPDEPKAERVRPRRRRGRWTAADWAELAATLAVAVAFLSLAARVLLF